MQNSVATCLETSEWQETRYWIVRPCTMYLSAPLILCICFAQLASIFASQNVVQSHVLPTAMPSFTVNSRACIAIERMPEMTFGPTVSIDEWLLNAKLSNTEKNQLVMCQRIGPQVTIIHTWLGICMLPTPHFNFTSPYQKVVFCITLGHANAYTMFLSSKSYRFIFNYKTRPKVPVLFE